METPQPVLVPVPVETLQLASRERAAREPRESFSMLHLDHDKVATVLAPYLYQHFVEKCTLLKKRHEGSTLYNYEYYEFTFCNEG